MVVIQPKLELKLNSTFEDLLKFSELEEDKLILQQFDGELENVYVLLNGVQVKVDLLDLYDSVSLLKDIQFRINK